MDDEDYRALIEVVTNELRRSAVSDIADERHYVSVDGETGERRLLDPKARLIGMLEAFDRHAAVQDRALVKPSLELINQALGGDGPDRAVVELADDHDAREIDLAEAPDMREVRYELADLLKSLRGPDRLLRR